MTGAGAVLAILASAVIVLGGLAALTRAIFKAAVDLRDNQRATKDNTTALAGLANQMDGRLTGIEQRLSANEGRLTALEHSGG